MAEDTAILPTIDTDVTHQAVEPGLVAILLAEYGTIGQDGKVVLCGIIDRFNVNAIRKKTSPFVLFIKAVETMSEPITISIIAPTLGVLLSGAADTADMVVDVSAMPKPRYVQVLQRMIFQTPEEGTYIIDVSYQGKSLGKVPFAVEFIKKEVELGDTSSSH